MRLSSLIVIALTACAAAASATASPLESRNSKSSNSKLLQKKNHHLHKSEKSSHHAAAPAVEWKNNNKAAAGPAMSSQIDYSLSALNMLTDPKTKAGDLIPNQYIVVFKNHVDMHTVDMHLSWLTAQFAPFTMSRPFTVQSDDSVSVTAFAGLPDEFSIFRKWFINGFKGYAARIPDVIAKSLKKLPEVAFVEQDSVVKLFESQEKPPSWGLARISERELPLPHNYTYPDSAGEGVDAYIVDTGVTIGHDDFDGRAVVGASFSTDSHDRDGNGHGTHVAGTVAGSSFGVAKKAKIVAVKVLNSQGSGSNSDVISGVEWVATEGPKRSKKAVANMSLGGGASAALDAAVRAAIDAGIMFAVAAGNSAGDACKLSPARVREALTVAASDKNDRLASFSERGKCVDIIAPGVDITSTWNNGRENTISGTSMASPHACGVLALALGEREFENVTAHKNYVINIGTRGVVTGVPKNTKNILLYADVTSEPQEPLPEDPNEPEDPEDPEDPDEKVCPFPECLFDPSCTSCCFEGVDC